MSSNYERELLKKLRMAEKAMMDTLDLFFEDPTDENLAVLQEQRNAVKKYSDDYGKVYRALRDAERAATTAPTYTVAPEVELPTRVPKREEEPAWWKKLLSHD